MKDGNHEYWGMIVRELDMFSLEKENLELCQGFMYEKYFSYNCKRSVSRSRALDKERKATIGVEMRVLIIGTIQKWNGLLCGALNYFPVIGNIQLSLGVLEKL